MLEGHGLRERQVRGPAAAGQKPEERTLKLRRYHCLSCGAVIVVGPRGLLRGRLYPAPVIALALGLFAQGKQSAAQVRRAVSPWAIVGATASGTWATLRRWVRAVREGRLFSFVRKCPLDWPLRKVAERAVSTLMALAPSFDRGPPPAHQAWRGALNLPTSIVE